MAKPNVNQVFIKTQFKFLPKQVFPVLLKTLAFNLYTINKVQ